MRARRLGALILIDGGAQIRLTGHSRGIRRFRSLCTHLDDRSSPCWIPLEAARGVPTFWSLSLFLFFLVCLIFCESRAHLDRSRWPALVASVAPAGRRGRPLIDWADQFIGRGVLSSSLPFEVRALNQEAAATWLPSTTLAHKARLRGRLRSAGRTRMAPSSSSGPPDTQSGDGHFVASPVRQVFV